MRKFLVIFLGLLVASQMIMTAADAGRLKGTGTSSLYEQIIYEPSGNRLIIQSNGLHINFSGLIICDSLANGLKEDDNCYWYKAGMLGAERILGVQGVQLKLTNTTDKMMIVKWSESSLSLGTFYGIPFLPGMKYTNAGNPSSTPDTIIPPHKTVSTTLYISNVSFSGGNWIQGSAYVRADNSLKAAVYMKVLNPDGTSEYCSAESPAIILPQSALAPFIKK